MRYTKIQANNQQFPYELQQYATSGSFFFTIPSGMTFNLSQTALVIQVKQTSVAARFNVSTTMTSQYINTIKISNSKGVLQNITDAWNYSNHTQFYCKKATTSSSVRNNTTVGLVNTADTGGRYQTYNRTDMNIVDLFEDGLTGYPGFPLIMRGVAAVAQDSYWFSSGTLGSMYPKTFFDIDRDFTTAEELTIEIILNPTDYYQFYTANNPNASLVKTDITVATTANTLEDIHLNVWTTNNGDTDWDDSFANVEQNRIISQIGTLHNTRMTLKPNPILFITWSPYGVGRPTGSNMYSNSIYPNVVRNNGSPDTTTSTVLTSYDLRINGEPFVQLATVSCSTSDNIAVNLIHYGNIPIQLFPQLWFVHISTFNDEALEDLHCHTAKTLNLPNMMDLTCDSVWVSASSQRSHQFMIGYKKSVRCRAGFLTLY